MIKNIQGEKWKQLQFAGYKSLRRKYAVSSMGRAASYTKDLNEDGKILNGSITSGYRTLNLHLDSGNGTFYLHREIAKFFCKKPSPTTYSSALGNFSETLENALSNVG